MCGHLNSQAMDRFHQEIPHVPNVFRKVTEKKQQRALTEELQRKLRFNHSDLTFIEHINTSISIVRYARNFGCKGEWSLGVCHTDVKQNRKLDDTNVLILCIDGAVFNSSE